MGVFYGSRSGHAHRYQCRGDDAHVGSGLCVGIGGVRVDRAVAGQILEAVSEPAVEAAVHAAGQVAPATADVRGAVERELEEAGYEASLAARRYNLVDREKRHVVRELEARWTVALERVTEVERRLADLEADTASRPKVGSAALMRLAHDLPAAGNAPTRDTRTKQRLTHLLIEDAVIDLDDEANEAVVIIHWIGGRHTELRVARVKTGRYPADHRPRPVDGHAQAGWSLAGS